MTRETGCGDALKIAHETPYPYASPSKFVPDSHTINRHNRAKINPINALNTIKYEAL